MNSTIEDHLDSLVALAKGGDQRRQFFMAAGGYRSDGAWVEAVNGAAVGGPHPPSHAEARVARKLGRGETLYVVRVHKTGAWAMAKPCHYCEKRLRDKGVRRVVYTVGPAEAGILWL